MQQENENMITIKKDMNGAWAWQIDLPSGLQGSRGGFATKAEAQAAAEAELKLAKNGWRK